MLLILYAKYVEISTKLYELVNAPYGIKEFEILNIEIHNMR